MSTGSPTTLRFLSYLSHSMLPVYQAVADFVGERLGFRTEVHESESFADLGPEGATIPELHMWGARPLARRWEQSDDCQAYNLAFLCGFPYIKITRRLPWLIEPLVAPVLQGERFGGRPIYFSDVIVHRDAPWTSFTELRGCSWSYNDPDSQSGYNITRYHLLRMGETNGFFGKVVRAGAHARSIRMVAAGEVDASAIDCHCLAFELREHPELADQIRVIDVLGPSTIQPVVIDSAAPASLKAAVRDALLAMSGDARGAQHLARGLVERYAPVTDADYDDIRAMLAASETAGFETLR